MERKQKLDDYMSEHLFQQEDMNMELEQGEMDLEPATEATLRLAAVEEEATLPDPESGITAMASEMARQLNPDASIESNLQPHSSVASCDDVDGTTASPTHPAASSPTHQSSSPTHPAATLLISSSPTHLSPGSGNEQTDYSLKKPFSYFKRSHKDKIGDSSHISSGQISKKPSVLSVLFGSQYDNAISQGRWS